MAKKKTPLEAIRTYCKECSCGDKEEIINCPVKTCPLWSYRIELSMMNNDDLEIDEIEEMKSVEKFDKKKKPKARTFDDIYILLEDE